MEKRERTVRIYPNHDKTELYSPDTVRITEKLAAAECQLDGDSVNGDESREIISGTLHPTYRIIKILGSGGTSDVFLAEHMRLGTLWAIKRIPKTLAGMSHYSAAAEVQLIQRLKHPALVYAIGMLEDQEYDYLVEEYVRGQNLRDYLAMHGPVDEETAISWFRMLCDVLGYLHAQEPPVIYRDMKPSNIMLQPDGNLKLLDLGLATQNAKKEGNLDERADIYALGVTMYQLMSGRGPLEFEGAFPPVRRFNPDISADMERILQRCLQRDPQKRYASVDQLLNDLQTLENDNAKKLKDEWKKNLRVIVGIVLMAGVLAGIIITIRTQLISYRKRWNEAQTQIQTISDSGEPSYDSYQEGLILMADGRAEEAIRQFDDAIAAEPEDGDIYIARGDAYFLLGEEAKGLNNVELRRQCWKSSFSDYEQALRLGSDKAEIKLSEITSSLEQVEQDSEVAAWMQSIAEAFEGDEREKIFSLIRTSEEAIKYLYRCHLKKACYSVGEKVVIFAYPMLYYGTAQNDNPEGRGIVTMVDDNVTAWVSGEWKAGKLNGTVIEELVNETPITAEGSFWLSKYRTGKMKDGEYSGNVREKVVYKTAEKDARGQIEDNVTSEFEIMYSITEGELAEVSKVDCYSP